MHITLLIPTANRPVLNPTRLHRQLLGKVVRVNGDRRGVIESVHTVEDGSLLSVVVDVPDMNEPLFDLDHVPFPAPELMVAVDGQVVA